MSVKSEKYQKLLALKLTELQLILEQKSNGLGGFTFRATHTIFQNLHNIWRWFNDIVWTFRYLCWFQISEKSKPVQYPVVVLPEMIGNDQSGGFEENFGQHFLPPKPVDF